MGGKTAMLFSVLYPEKVAALIIADIGPKSYPQHHQDILKALSMLDFNTIRSRDAADEVLSGYIKELGIRQFLLKNLYWVRKEELALRINLPVLIDKNLEIGKSLPEGTVYEGNTLFLRGANSGYIEDTDEILIKIHFPNSEIVTVSKAGHWLHAENPKEFYNIVMNFL
jgi:pimeloyl-ACP methyl ester carboxylesterase